MKTNYLAKLRHQPMWRKITSLPVLAIAVLLVVGSSVMPAQVNADSLSQQIQDLQNQNAQNQNVVAQLQDQAVSYQDAIVRLQSQINLLQGQIDDNLAKQSDLKQKIIDNENELARQRKVLGESIKTMYVEGQISTIEILATSKNLSDFVDKQEYHTAVENKIQDTLKSIADLQNQLKDQQTQVQTLLDQQTQQQNQLASSRTEQNNMLSYNQQQQADYNQKTKDNQAKIADLIAQQRKANENAGPGGYYFLRFPGPIKSHDPNVNDYPKEYSGFGMSTAPGCVDNDGPDRWGYCTRQCVSYAAWAVERSGRTAPTYYGNAKNWVAAARNDGIAIYSDPQPGDVAISTAGAWGHAMYVEVVNGNQIYVSQYNQQLTGQYSTQWRTYR